MSDSELDDLIRGLARVSDADVARWDLARPEHEMCEAIMTTDPTTDDTAPLGFGIGPDADPTVGTDSMPGDEARVHEISLTGHTRGRRRHVGLVIGVAAVAAAVVAGVVLAGDTRDDTGTVGPASERGAEDGTTVPRLLVDLPGWEVERVDERSSSQGELTLTDGEQTLDVHWQPADQHQWKLDDVADSTGPGEPATALGHPAELFVYREPATGQGAAPAEGSDLPTDALGDFTTLWLDGQISVEARGAFRSIEAYRAALDALVEVDGDRWSAALPASAVPPEARPATVDAMLEDIPLPPGIDLASLRRGDLTVDRYQLGAEVTGTVTCRWIDAWVAARNAGDAEGVQQAVDAMAGSHDWAVLHKMTDEGDWPDVIWEYADALPADAPIGPVTIEDSYSQGLGCDPNAPAGL
jgi:hypothetical protein